MNWVIKPLSSDAGTKDISVPADKSITHRAVMLSAFVSGNYQVKNYLAAEDCKSTINAFRAMGVKIDEVLIDLKPSLNITSSGKLVKPAQAINSGNSGTTVRLLSGILAGQDFSAEIIGDESLSRRPMKRVIEPLRQMGAEITAKEDNYLPLKIKGARNLKPITYNSKIASAQVKSCVLFAGMLANGKTTFIEPQKSRDHSERMLKSVGVALETDNLSVSVTGPVKISPEFKVVNVPGDISGAAFFLIAGALLPGADFTVKEIGINPTRSGIIDVLKDMKARVSVFNEHECVPELIADVSVKTSKLKAVEIKEEMIPSLIDEIPVIALAATQAEGTTVISGAKELRVKESDRLRAVSEELSKMGANIEEKEDGLIIHGPTPLTGAAVDSHGDHRIAMTLAVAALIAKGDTTIKNTDCVNISFPEFKSKLQDIGANIKSHE